MQHLKLIYPKEDKEKLIEDLINRYGMRVTKFAYTYVKDWSIAEDITQEVFITIYDKIATFRHESNVLTWIYSITANKCKDYLRKSYFKRTLLTDLIGSFQQETESSAEDVVTELNKNRVIAELVLALPVKYREIIMLYYYEELSINEISVLLDEKVSTIKTRLQRGRHKLKVFLGDEFIE